MKKLLVLFLSLIVSCSLFFVACDSGNNGESSDVARPVTDTSINASETNSAFLLSTENGTVTNQNNIYTITKSGTYTLKGRLEGQVVVNNTDSNDTADIIIELDKTTIVCDSDSPVKIISGYNDVQISAKKNTENVIKDTREHKTEDEEDQGLGAIYSKADLKIKGKGTLEVKGNYNNGIHVTKDLKVQNLKLKVTAYNNAIKANKSFKMAEGGLLVAISTNGDGIKTESSLSGKGNVTVEAGIITVYSAGDGIQSARDFYMQNGVADDGTITSPTLKIYTATYSGYTASDAVTTSYKGIKVKNEIKISSGSLVLKTYDDGLHADYGTVLEDGSTGQGSVTISGGTVTTEVFSPENKTATGKQIEDGWGNQQAVIGADAIHADYRLTVTGGTLNLDSAYEGFEANTVLISGGKTYIYANDDGINACNLPALLTSKPSVTIDGGYVDISVSPDVDTDGIDSNGKYIQNGGVVIVRGPNTQDASAIDTKGTAKVNGGTLILIGYGSITRGTGVYFYTLSAHSKGGHTVTIDGTAYSFVNAYEYGTTLCYSDVSVTP